MPLHNQRVSRRRVIALLGAFAAIPAVQACAPAASPTAAPQPAKPADKPAAAATTAPAATKPAAAGATKPAAAGATKPAAAGATKPAAQATPAQSKPAAGGQAVTIRVADRSSPSYVKFMETWIEQYHQEQSAIRIEFEPKSADWDQKNIAAMAAGTAPDVPAYCCDRFRSLQEKGQFLGIDDYIKSTMSPEDLNDFWAGQYRGMNFQGKQIAIPYYINVNAAFYNREALEEAGLQKPKNDWTHADFLSYAQKLVKRSGDTVERWGLILDYPQYFRRPVSFVWGNGGGFNDPKDASKFTFTQKETIESAQWLHDLAWKHKVSSVSSADLGGLGLAPAFWAGKSGLYFEGVHILEAIPEGLKFTWDLAPPPIGAAGSRGQRTANDGYAIYARTKHPDQSWTVIRALTAPETMKMRQDMVGLIASRKSVANEWPKVHPDKNLESLLETMDDAQVDPLAIWPQAAEVYNKLKPTLEQLNILNKISVPEAMAKMQADAESVVKQG